MQSIIDKVFTYDVLILPPEVKKTFVRLHNYYPTSHLKILTLDDLKADFFFNFGPKEEMFLFSKFNLSINDAHYLADAFYDFKFSTFSSMRLKKTKAIKEEMLKNGYLVANHYFASDLKQKSIAVIGYDQANEELAFFINQYNLKVDFSFSSPIKEQLAISVYNDLEAEISAFFNDVSRLLASNKELSDIVLLNPPEEYFSLLERYSYLYRIPLNLPVLEPLITFPLAQAFLKNLDEGILGDDALSQKIRQLCGQYPAQGIANYNLFLTQLFSRTKIAFPKYQKAISVTDFFPLDESKEVFVLGFSQGRYPLQGRDFSYLNSQEKKSLGQSDNHLLNAEKRHLLFWALNLEKNLHLSYSKYVNGEENFPPSYLDKISKVTFESPTFDFDYSAKRLAIYHAILLDWKRKYNYVSSNLRILNQSEKIPYRKFDNSFKGIKDDFSLKPFVHSYSSFKTYYECAFHYYLERIIGLRDTNESFNLKYGTLAHKLLQDAYRSNFDFEKCFIEAKAMVNLNVEEEIFLLRLKEELKMAISFIHHHEQRMKLNHVLVEKKYDYSISQYARIVGTIDKVYFIGEEGKKVVLVDYKTGLERFNPALVEYGASLQLPFYDFLFQICEDNDYQIIGLYIHPLFLDKRIFLPEGHDEGYYFSHQRLQGPTSEDISNQEAFNIYDGEYYYVSNIKYKNDGQLSKSSKTFNADFFVNLANIAKEKILAGDKKIRELDFAINPLRIGNKVDACSHCPFRDVCYRQDKDYRDYEVKEEIDDEQ